MTHADKSSWKPEGWWKASSHLVTIRRQLECHRKPELHTRAWPWMKVMWLLDQSEATSMWREERLCFGPEWGRHFCFNSSDLSFICSHLPCSCLRFFLVFEAISVHNCILSHILRYLTWKAHFWKFKTSFIAVSLRSIDAKTEWEWDYWRCCLSWWNIGEKIHHFSIFVSSFSSESLLS